MNSGIAQALPTTTEEIKASKLASLKRTLKMLVEKPIEEGHWDTEDDEAIELIAQKIEELEG